MDWGIVASAGVAVLGLLNTWLVFLVKKAEKRHELVDQKFEQMRTRHEEKIDSLRDRDQDIANQVSSISIAIAGQYLKRDEFQATMTAQTMLMEKGFERLQNQFDRLSASK